MRYLADEASPDLSIVRGDGCVVFDDHEHEYIDFIAGWCVGTVGWNHHEVMHAMTRRSEAGVYVPPFFGYAKHEDFARQLIELAPGKRLKKVYRSASGFESIEIALRVARHATGRQTIVTMETPTQSLGDKKFSLTDHTWSGAANIMRLPIPNEYRGVTAGDVINRFEQLIRASGDIAAFIAEPVISAGAIVPPKEFLPEIQRLCRQRDILFMIDETATGFGRCGALFASSLWDLDPDMLCLGPSMTGGYGTMGAALVSQDVFDRSQAFRTDDVYSWTPLDVAAAQAVLDAVLRNRLWENSHAMGQYMLSKLKEFENRPFVGQVRNAGLLLGIAIVKDKTGKEPDPKKAESLVQAARQAGVLLHRDHHIILLSPALTLTKDRADQGLERLQKVFEV